MAYSDFSLHSVKKQFELVLVEQNNFFRNQGKRSPSASLEKVLENNVPLALASNTEKSRSEMIIAPILLDLREQLNNEITIFSGTNFVVDISQGLNGSCDFLISRSRELLFLTSPIITLVEAKKEDLNAGLGQCVAEMVAAQWFNQKEDNPIAEIYGAVTSGTVWKFLKLHDQTVWIDLSEYYLREIDQILGILSAAVLENPPDFSA